MTGTTTGTLVRFTRKQFGIIQPDDGSLTVWAHWTKLPEDADEGDHLEFRVGNGLRGNFAYEIRRVEKKEAPKAREKAKAVRKGRKEMAGD